MNAIQQWILFIFVMLMNTAVNAESQRLPGKFVWAELITYDMSSAEHFYGQLFDWQFTDEKNYRIAWKNNDPVAGLVFRPRPQNVSAKSRWVSYVSVKDISAVKQAIIAANGRVVADPRNIDGLGELMVFADAEGALFGIIHSAGSDPEDYLAEPGQWIWIQLFSKNAETAAQFYQQVGNYERFDNPQQKAAYLLAKNGYARAALSTISAQHADAMPTWVPFLRVDDIAETLRKVTALRGKIVVAPRRDLYDNSVAMIEAPDGSAVGIMVWNPAAHSEKNIEKRPEIKSATVSGDSSP